MRRTSKLLHRIVLAVVVTSGEPFTESGRARLRDSRGQTTAEYALVLLGAAGVALLLLGWATQSGAIGQLFNTVLDGVIGRAK